MSEPTRTLGDALRSLPVPPPPGDGWQRLAQELPRRRGGAWRGWSMAAALALACVLGSLWLPGMQPVPPPSSSRQPDADSAPFDLDALRAESAQWDLLLAALDTTVDSPESAATQAVLGDRIALIDLLLGDSDSAATEQALWSERVLLLRALYRLRSVDDPQLAQLMHDGSSRPTIL